MNQRNAKQIKTPDNYLTHNSENMPGKVSIATGGVGNKGSLLQLQTINEANPIPCNQLFQNI